MAQPCRRRLLVAGEHLQTGSQASTAGAPPEQGIDWLQGDFQSTASAEEGLWP